MSGRGATMRKRNGVLLVVVAVVLSSAASAEKLTGTTSLKDFQPAGTTDKKNKTQQFDFIFDTTDQEYTCRTKSKIKATDYPVGSQVRYQVNNDKGKVKNASGKETDCTIVRVEQLRTTPAAPPK
jgi:type IV pilus biogenesis protein CpaD/CtpE